MALTKGLVNIQSICRAAGRQITLSQIPPVVSEVWSVMDGC